MKLVKFTPSQVTIKYNSETSWFIITLFPETIISPHPPPLTSKLFQYYLSIDNFHSSNGYIWLRDRACFVCIQTFHSSQGNVVGGFELSLTSVTISITY